MILAAQSPLGHYWAKLTDPNLNPFRGLYQLNAFDLSIMIPYFWCWWSWLLWPAPLLAGLCLFQEPP